MATTLRPRSDLPQSVHLQSYPIGLPMTELDLKDNRYPSISPTTPPNRDSSPMMRPLNRTSLDARPDAEDVLQRSNDLPQVLSLSPRWATEQLRDGNSRAESESHIREDSTNQQQPQLSEPFKHEIAVSYALPPGARAARRVVERYSLDDDGQGLPSSGGSGDARPIESSKSTPQDPKPPSPSWQKAQHAALQPVCQPLQSSTPRHPSLPAAGVGTVGSSPSMAASPSYNNRSSNLPMTVSSVPRVYAQQPTYVTPPNVPTGMSPAFSPKPTVPQEEVCVECAMRDQDMADVDVTSPGVWDRESDVLYEELLRREQEDNISGVVSLEPYQHQRPRAKGGRLTESNLKIWLSINPREPTSRQHALEAYVKAQRMLLEAEAMARSRAMQESRQLDNKMRDAYSQLRRSAYDMGTSAAPADDVGGVRIKSPSQSGPHARSHSRDVTLLENGMIVEHVNVRREEREERERRRKTERRERSQARKSSRSSAVDVKSIISVSSLVPQTDGSKSPRLYSRYSQSNVTRPTSVLTAPADRRPSLPQAYSQASLSDAQSLGPPSPRSRFFGIKNRSGGWRSQDSLAPSRISGMSGSMMNMHVALQREEHGHQTHSPLDIPQSFPPVRHSQAWPPDPEVSSHETKADEKPKKKKSGLSKMWRIVTGSKKEPQTSNRDMSERHEDDMPLAPPPSLSYLVDRRRPGELNTTTARHTSTPSLPSTMSPRNPLSPPALSPMSPGTAPSSAVPSSASSRPSAGEQDRASNEKKDSCNHGDQEEGSAEEHTKAAEPKIFHPVTSGPDVGLSPQVHQVDVAPPTPQPSPRPESMMVREKSLPPLPDEFKASTTSSQPDDGPQTRFTYDLRHIPLDSTVQRQDFFPPHVPIRENINRRQSFGGTTSRPDLALQTMPQNGTPRNVQQVYPGNQYEEFGHSRRSLGPLSNSSLPPLKASSKRRSKFSLASIFGKRSPMADSSYLSPHSPRSQDFPSYRSHRSQADDEALSNGGYATSASKHSALSGGPRMSLTSRKAIEELVAQSPDFVAYRYPSNDQRLDLLR